MPNAVIYARFSCSKQREESIEDQVRVCSAAAMRAGDRVVHVYADSAISGKTDDRPQFKRMVQDSAKGLFETVYIYKTDRFARNRYDSATYKARLRKNGVRVVSASEAIPEGPDGILLEAMFEGMAEYYSAQLSENVKRGIEGKALRCQVNGRVLYGYRKGADGRFEVDPDEAEAVRLLFERVAGGATVASAIASVKALGKGRRFSWSKSTVGKLLRREQYKGVYTFNGHREEGGMPAIVDAQTWEKVQARLGARKHAPRGHDAPYALSGKLFDSEGNVFVGSCGTGRDGTRHHYYRCVRTGEQHPRDETDARIVEAVLAALAEPGTVDIVAAAVLQSYEDAVAEDVKVLELTRKALEKAERAYSNALDAVIALGVTDELTDKVKAAEADRDALRVDLAELERGVPRITMEMAREWVAHIAEVTSPATILQGFVTRAEFHPDGTISADCIIDELRGYKDATNHQVDDGGSHRCHMVDHTTRYANSPTGYGNLEIIPGGFRVVA